MAHSVCCNTLQTHTGVCVEISVQLATCYISTYMNAGESAAILTTQSEGVSDLQWEAGECGAVGGGQ